MEQTKEQKQLEAREKDMSSNDADIIINDNYFKKIIQENETLKNWKIYFSHLNNVLDGENKKLKDEIEKLEFHIKKLENKNTKENKQKTEMIINLKNDLEQMNMNLKDENEFLENIIFENKTIIPFVYWKNNNKKENKINNNLFSVIKNLLNDKKNFSIFPKIEIIRKMETIFFDDYDKITTKLKDEIVKFYCYSFKTNRFILFI